MIKLLIKYPTRELNLCFLDVVDFVHYHKSTALVCWLFYYNIISVSKLPIWFDRFFQCSRFAWFWNSWTFFWKRWILISTAVRRVWNFLVILLIILVTKLFCNSEVPDKLFKSSSRFILSLLLGVKQNPKPSEKKSVNCTLMLASL